MPYYLRKNARLRGYDYSLPGAYFITICAHRRSMIFGRIEKRACKLTPLGNLVERLILELASHHPGLSLDQWVVMPNHVHIIFLIHQMRAGEKMQYPDLRDVVALFKSSVTREARKCWPELGVVWQRGYHDHVIRHEGALQRVREYVRNNPQQWELDCENDARKATSGFYKWMKEYVKHLET